MVEGMNRFHLLNPPQSQQPLCAGGDGPGLLKALMVEGSRIRVPCGLGPQRTVSHAQDPGSSWKVGRRERPKGAGKFGPSLHRLSPGYPGE